MSSFRCLYRQGFARVAACTVSVSLAEPMVNANAILQTWRKCAEQGVAIAVFPELGITGYSLDDLRFQQLVLDEAERALRYLIDASHDVMTVAVVGLPLRRGDALYNCAAIIHKGRLLGVVPKTFLPRYREFYEPRHFSSGADCRGSIDLWGSSFPFGTDLLFPATDIQGLILGVEICEDLWAPLSPSTHQALAGATVIANLSASPVTVGRAEEREKLCSVQSMKIMGAYLYAAAGQGESTTDLAWDGQLTLHEVGQLLERSQRFPQHDTFIVADIDLELIRQERMRSGYFATKEETFRKIPFTLAPPIEDRGLRREVLRFPFVPNNPQTLDQDCWEAWKIQVHALCQRLRASHSQRMVIGVSGGLDSALALLVAVRAADEMGWPRHTIVARTMPGFATGKESLALAQALMEHLGVDSGLLDIRPTAEAMLKEIGHPYAKGEPVYDVTFENVQAGLRTDFLFRLANYHHGIVIGTGDLSEIALGWCTYGVGDQMAHYNVNSGLPKSLIQHMIRWVARQEEHFSSACRETLERIVTAEISPELVPNTGQGIQSTEKKIGPYPLQDFTLYYVLRYGFSPCRIAFLQEKAWGKREKGEWPVHYPENHKIAYQLSDIVHWMTVFVERFFATSQFKRSAMPNGPKILAGGALSPRGDWRAPSDGNAQLWVESLVALSAGHDVMRPSQNKKA
ncbi:NAD(+) synthase [Saccharibacter sp. 17.LH.SD]|nr:NAD(+) synthase [Saccharibacter sp. 17.LH.SD]